MKLTFAQWVQILVLAVAGAAGWTTLKVSLSNVQATVASIQEQLNQVRRDYLRKDVYDPAMADAKARMDRLEERMDRGK